MAQSAKIAIGSHPPLWLALLAGAAAGGMGWGIRGQFGHETGAMLAGSLVGLTLMLMFGARLQPRTVFVAVAMLTVGIGIGGLETYGQTIGLTQNKEVLGNTHAFLWGELGLFIKGGCWIAIGATFFGSALSGRGWSIKEIASALGIMMATFLLGQLVLNGPFQPDAHRLPAVYFSADWRWTPDATLEVLKPRPERWGGLLFAWLALMSYRGFVQRDRLAVVFGCAGFVAGGIGFAGGQLWQAGHAWFPDVYKQVFGSWDALINWWNMMEITFGCIWGGGLAGLVHRFRGDLRDATDDAKPLPIAVLLALAAVHVVMLYAWTFMSMDWFDAIADLGIPMTVLPFLLITAGGYRGASWVALPITALPIMAKTFVAMSVDASTLSKPLGVLLCLLLPLLLMSIALRPSGLRGFTQLSVALASVAITYFALNYAFFQFPWPWQSPTGRTVSAWIFTFDVAMLMGVIGWVRRGSNGIGFVSKT